MGHGPSGIMGCFGGYIRPGRLYQRDTEIAGGYARDAEDANGSSTWSAGCPVARYCVHHPGADWRRRMEGVRPGVLTKTVII